MDEQPTDVLQASLKQYESQLIQVTVALSATENGPERDTLMSLYKNLEELIKLTKENVKHILNDTGTEKPPQSSIDREYALFKAELSIVGQNNCQGDPSVSECAGSSCSRTSDNMFEDVKNDLKALEGIKCQAPHTRSWGGTSYHNAIIAGIESAEDIQTVNDIQVRVLFTNPTDKDMLPCTHYFKGECRFADEDCWFSHGNIVQFSELREYSEPDFSLVSPGIKALVKGDDDLWAHAQLKKVIDNEKCEVKFETSGIEKIVNLHDILPLVDKDVSSLADDTDDTDDSEVDSEMQPVWDKNMVDRALSNPSTSVLGEWEKYTKGIGSRLMAQMGYVAGSGLGKFGEGRIEPVEAVVLPAGKSLDHCMNLKEKAEGQENLFSVDKRLARLRKRQKALRKKQYREEKEKKDVFDFINLKLSGSKQPTTVGKWPKTMKSSLKSESTHGLNIASFNISEDIRRVERELAKLNESLSRHNEGSATYSVLLSKQKEKKKQLNILKSSGIAVDNERSQRSDYKKMTIF